jgi:hypothetical protein
MKHSLFFVLWLDSSDTKDSQEVEIMEKESRPRKSSGERKKKSKKLKKAQPETVKNTWGSTKDDEENVGKRNGKRCGFFFMDPIHSHSL